MTDSTADQILRRALNELLERETKLEVFAAELDDVRGAIKILEKGLDQRTKRKAKPKTIGGGGVIATSCVHAEGHRGRRAVTRADDRAADSARARSRTRAIPRRHPQQRCRPRPSRETRRLLHDAASLEGGVSA